MNLQSTGGSTATRCVQARFWDGAWMWEWTKADGYQQRAMARNSWQKFFKLLSRKTPVFVHCNALSQHLKMFLCDWTGQYLLWA